MMPLIAHDAGSGDRIDITCYPDPRAELTDLEFVCPSCGEPMTMVCGEQRINHFRHRSGSECTFGIGESMDHLMAKEELARHYRAAHPGALVELERRIDLPGDRYRIADVLITWPGGHAMASEAQLASIRPDDLEQRSNDYLIAGVDVVWWLGKAANTGVNRDWCIQRYGAAHLIQIIES